LRFAQQEVKRITTQVDVARSKASWAIDADRYLLSEIDSLGKAMKCKYSLVVRGSFRLLLLTSSPALLLFADACLDDKAEAHWVNAHLNAAQTHASSAADSFWADRSKAKALTVLQDRISHAGALAETCRLALVVVHQVMFPLNDQPDGLAGLLKRFENREAIYRFVCQHLRCGDLVALSFM
jgi:hypothetical protein